MAWFSACHAPQNQSVGWARRAAVIAGPPPGRYKAKPGIEPTSWIVVGCNLQYDGVAAAPFGFSKDGDQQRAADAAAAASRQDANRQDFGLAAQIARQHKADRPLLLPSAEPEPSGQGQDAFERIHLPRLFRKTGAMQQRERDGGADGYRADLKRHGRAAATMPRSFGMVTSGGRRYSGRTGSSSRPDRIAAVVAAAMTPSASGAESGTMRRSK